MKKIQDFRIKKHQWLNNSSYIVELETDDEIPEIKAGNFAELEVPNSKDIFLRRPLSILDVNYTDNTMSFYIKVVGKGTKKLGNLPEGEKVNIIYPLGNSFSNSDSSRVLIVGGGSGIAPFILLARELHEKKIQTTFLFGARSADEIVMQEAFSMFGEVLVTTEDGSMGEKGLVTSHSIFNKEEFNFDKIYTCGPDPMMKAVAFIAMERRVPCEVSLENMMACGFGACLCCVTETLEGNKCVCTEGPVFNIKDLAW